MDVNLQTYTNRWNLISAKIVDSRLQLQAGISQHHTLRQNIFQNFIYLLLVHVHTHKHLVLAEEFKVRGQGEWLGWDLHSDIGIQLSKAGLTRTGSEQQNITITQILFTKSVPISLCSDVCFPKEELRGEVHHRGRGGVIQGQRLGRNKISHISM